MIELIYKTYFDKVFGCWLGKCIAGTIGMPYEGIKQLMEMEYSPELIAAMVPNDDLDLQVLWLEVLEKKGRHFTSVDLAEAFYNQCPYAMGEYAIFKKNFSRRILPPDCGSYNNDYYLEGMGCPIRSEIWACVAPGDPALAADCAARDGVLDHAGDSVYAEQFLAAVEATAFIETNLEKCLDEGLKFISADSKIARLIRDTRRWCKTCSDGRETRSMILRHLGHPDCTNLYQNIGFTLLALHYGQGDFIRTAMIALNCGFDTDCTCATAGAILGIHNGAEKLIRQYGFKDLGFKLDVRVERRSNTLHDLAEDTCRMGLEFAPLNKSVMLTDAPPYTPVPVPDKPPLVVEVRYNGEPVIGLGDTRTLTLILRNQSEKNLTGIMRLRLPVGWLTDVSEIEVDLQSDEMIEIPITVTAPDALHELSETNMIETIFEGSDNDRVSHTFGLTGATVWTAYGPFWENIVTVPPLKIGESYFKHLGQVEGEGASLDRVRDYHLNAFADLEKEYMALEMLESSTSGERINLYRDKFSFGDIFGWQGPCVVYLVRRFISPQARTVFAQIGHSDAFKVWLNGKLMAERDTVAWWTAENVHLPGVRLREGENTLVLRLTRRSQEADFSIVFTDAGTCGHHYTDLVSINPSAKTK